MAYKVINIDWVLYSMWWYGGRWLNMKTNRNMPLYTNFKTDNNDSRQKYLNNQLTIVFTKNLINLHQSLFNSWKRFSCRGANRVDKQSTQSQKIIHFLLFLAGDQKKWKITLQLLSKFSLDSDFCHNYLHTPCTQEVQIIICSVFY